MSLLNFPSTPFPPVFSLSTTTPTPLTGIRLNPCATPLGSGPSPDTGYEPNVSDEHTPINLPTSNMGFQQEYDARIAASEDLNLHRYSGVKQQPANGSKQSSQFVETRFIRDWPQETVGGLILLPVGLVSVCGHIAKQLFQVFFESVSNGREIETKTKCKHSKTGKNLNKILERKAGLAVRGENLAQQRLCEAETDVEVEHWEKEKF